MSTSTLKWAERSKVSSQFPSHGIPFCIGYKFRKTWFLLTEDDKIISEENKELLQNLKMNNIYMQKRNGIGLCTICSNKECKGKKNQLHWGLCLYNISKKS